MEKREVEETHNHFVLRTDYEVLETKYNDLREEFNRHRNLVYEFMLEQDVEQIESYENDEYDSFVMH